jgi:hypothetical protein
MYRKLNYSLKLVSFASRKRRGDIIDLFEKFGGDREFGFLLGKYSYSHISNVLNGRRKNTEIVNKAYRLSYRRKTNTSLV